MKDNKVLSAIYGIAIFVALIGVVGLLYNAIEMLSYTTFYERVESHGGTLYRWYEPTEVYTDLQKPFAIALLVASLFGIVGICAGIAYLFAKKSKLKIICVSCIALAVVAALVSIIVISAKWKSYYSQVNYAGRDKLNNLKFIGNDLDSDYPDLAQAFTIYSTSLASAIENFICFAVVAALLVYDFVKNIFGKKKEAEPEAVAEEITEN